MFQAILAAIMGVIGPIFQGISGIVNSIYSEKSTEVTAQGTVVVAAIQGEKAVEQRWWFAAIIPPAIAFPYVVYIWKAILWDKVIMHGTTATDAIKDTTLSWTFSMVIGYYLLHSLTRTFR